MMRGIHYLSLVRHLAYWTCEEIRSASMNWLWKNSINKGRQYGFANKKNVWQHVYTPGYSSCLNEGS